MLAGPPIAQIMRVAGENAGRDLGAFAKDKLEEVYVAHLGLKCLELDFSSASAACQILLQLRCILLVRRVQKLVVNVTGRSQG